VPPFDWTDWLGPDRTITDSTWEIDGPDDALELGVDDFAPSISDEGDATAAYLVGGTLWATYVLTNHITASDGETADHSIRVVVRHL
jgi:hypothetical protein